MIAYSIFRQQWQSFKQVAHQAQIKPVPVSDLSTPNFKYVIDRILHAAGYFNIWHFNN